MKKKQVYVNESIPEIVPSQSQSNETHKEESVRRSARLKKVQQNKKLTGKSKEYINSLSQKGCPIGRKKGKCGCTISNSKKSLNVKKSGGQNKKIGILKDEPFVVEDLNEKHLEITEIGDEDVIKDFEVILLKD